MHAGGLITVTAMNRLVISFLLAAALVLGASVPAHSAQGDATVKARADVRLAYDAARAASVLRGGKFITKRKDLRSLAREISKAEPSLRVRVAKTQKLTCSKRAVYLIERGSGKHRITIAKRAGAKLVVLRAGRNGAPRIRERSGVPRVCDKRFGGGAA